VSAALPRVSVLLPVRNGLPWLTAALDSVWSQTFTDFELLVVEDGSTDGTAAELARHTDPRLRILPTGGIGLARALNHGLAHARGALVARHDADDLSCPERFSRQVAFFDAHPDVDVLASVADYIAPDGAAFDNDWVRAVRRQHDAATTPEQIARLMPVTCCITHGSVMMRAAAVRGAAGYRHSYDPADDYDLWLRLLPQHQFAKLPEPLYRYRVHAGQLGARAVARQTHHAIRAKLEWLRRVEPGLSAQARLAATGAAPGNAWYARVAPDAGFTPVGVDDDWDVLALTDFTDLDGPLAWWRRARARVHGNFVVRSRAAAIAGKHV
jgi:glycosyltransferase involved in cell wall biosynthesis